MMVSGETWGILGSGFGLYGYLPAVAERTGGVIYTLDRYRETIRRREDIKGYENRIVFVGDTKAVFAHCNAVVIALRPADQELILSEMLDRKWTGKVIIEKPLARTPELAFRLLERLMAGGVVFRIGFTLGATGWFSKLAQCFAANQQKTVDLNLRWRFHAHHYRHALDIWKRYPAQGGGATRFYAIHLMALFTKLGMDIPVSYEKVTTGRNEEPECRFTVSNGRWNASVLCDSKWEDKPHFGIRAVEQERVLFEIALDDPFRESSQTDEPIPDDHKDARIGYLRTILNSLDEKSSDSYVLYVKHVTLWSQLEKKG